MHHKPTVPQSPEVALHELRADVAALRAQIDPLVTRLIPLLERIHPLCERAGDVADAIDHAPGDATWETTDRVNSASGTWELPRVFQRLVDAWPDGADIVR